LSGCASGRQLGPDDVDPFEDLLDTVRAYFVQRYREGNGRLPEAHPGDRQALLVLVYDEAGGRIDVARAYVDELFAAGFGGAPSLFEMWLVREWWVECNDHVPRQPLSQKLRTMLGERVLREGAIVQQVHDKRLGRMWRGTA
jgi:hypothetical protein